MIKKWCQIWLCVVKQCLIWFKLSFLRNFGNKLRNTNFKFYQNSLVFFNWGTCCQIKICPGFFVLLFFCFFLTFLQKYFWNKKVSIDLKFYWNTLMKILYLKGYNWLLFQNLRVKNDFFGYRRCEALAKHIKPF